MCLIVNRGIRFEPEHVFEGWKVVVEHYEGSFLSPFYGFEAWEIGRQHTRRGEADFHRSDRFSPRGTVRVCEELRGGALHLFRVEAKKDALALARDVSPIYGRVLPVLFMGSDVIAASSREVAVRRCVPFEAPRAPARLRAARRIFRMVEVSFDRPGGGADTDDDGNS